MDESFSEKFNRFNRHTFFGEKAKEITAGLELALQDNPEGTGITRLATTISEPEFGLTSINDALKAMGNNISEPEKEYLEKEQRTIEQGLQTLRSILTHFTRGEA